MASVFGHLALVHNGRGPRIILDASNNRLVRHVLYTKPGPSRYPKDYIHATMVAYTPIDCHFYSTLFYMLFISV